jgi:thiamine pyrophosphate-dependent acetolactate synthase large subunit-like protein
LLFGSNFHARTQSSSDPRAGDFDGPRNEGHRRRFLLERLGAWGVKRIYGYPGDGINGILTALGRNPSMEFMQARHEELAALMACGHAKFSGEIGVCLATSGPGAIPTRWRC